jgi:hypothetical protein
MSDLGAIPEKFSSISLDTIQLLKLGYRAFFAFPVLIVTVVLYYLLTPQTKKSYEILIYPYIIFSLFMLLYVLIDAGIYVIDEFKEAGIYAVLVFSIIILTAVIIYIIKKKEEQKFGLPKV